MQTADALLLDTHVWVWFASGEASKLKPKTVETIQIAGRTGRLRLAAISLWEVAMLAAKGRIEIDLDIQDWLNEAVLRTGVAIVPLDTAIAARSCQIELLQADPADRIIVASALKADASLMTADAKIQAAAKRLELNIIKP
jgi:PIN domain nuclease of toxin-antitoxin system